jgi:hypothetical protein
MIWDREETWEDEKRKDWNDEKDEDIETRPNTLTRAKQQRTIDIPIFPFSASVKQLGIKRHTGRNSPEILFTAQGWQTFFLNKEKRRKIPGMHVDTNVLHHLPLLTTAGVCSCRWVDAFVFTAWLYNVLSIWYDMEFTVRSQRFLEP